MNKKIYIGIGVVVVVVLGVWGWNALSSSSSLGLVVGAVSHTQGRYDAAQGFSVNGNITTNSSSLDTNAVVGDAGNVLTITTSTALAGTFPCQYSEILITGTTGNATLTLPAATTTNVYQSIPPSQDILATGTCLADVSSYSGTYILNQSTNTVTLATSTGDTFFYNGTSTAGGTTLSSSSAYTLYDLHAISTGTSTVGYTLGFNGIGH